MGSAQRRRDSRHLVTRNHSTRPWSLRSPDTTRLWETNQTTFQHFTCIHFSSKLDGLSAEDEAVFSLFSLLCSVRASVAYSIGDLGGVPTQGFYCEEHFSTRDIPVVTTDFSFHSPSIVSRRLSAQFSSFSSFSYHHLCCLLLALEIPFGDVDIEL